MFTFDRETAIIVAIIMCIAASIYMYKELKTTREEMESVKGMNGKISSFLSQITPVRVPGPAQKIEQCVKKDTVKETQVDEDFEENQDSEEESSE
tara:strand:- start:3707 stop:3991 length:285 start_codon:yes stop_codon:yes gene_type:complete